MNKNFFGDKAKRKLKEKRFFIVLACCILAIGAITFLNSIPKQENIQTENKSSDIKYSLPEPISEDEKIAEVKTYPPIEEDDVTSENKLPESEEDFNNSYLAQASNETETPYNPPLRKITPPIAGKQLNSFSKSPAYSDITGDWRTHEAIDYEAIEGSEVAAADSGVILKISESDPYGATIIIDHENTMKTLYANVLAKDGLKEGDIITKGDIIGTAAPTSVCEKYDECHIHFEVMIDNKNIDPKEWLE